VWRVGRVGPGGGRGGGGGWGDGDDMWVAELGVNVGNEGAGGLRGAWGGGDGGPVCEGSVVDAGPDEAVWSGG